jgi:uncharacterized YigZ family protein
MDAGYLSTLTAPVTGQFRDKGSRFLAFAFPVAEAESAEKHLQALRKTYYDARHHCLAYRLGPQGETLFASDDGEPAHTAGTPILAAIRSRNLTDVAVVVVRYFGGIKLGVRGLIEAYRGAAEDALAQATTEEVIPRVTLSLDFDYPQTSEINRVLHPFDMQVVSAEYGLRIRQVLAIEARSFPELSAALGIARIPFTLIDLQK